MSRFQKKLAQLKSQNRLRSLKFPSGVDLSSNDYLGFKDHPILKQAALNAIENGMPLGSGGSRLLRGHTEEHQNLEDFAAKHYGCGKALYFANGFLANYSLLTTLPQRHDVVLYDALVHASVRDGIQAGTAKSVKIPHNDLNEFESALKRFRDGAETIWIAVESVYSMDGDFAPLQELHALAETYGAMLIIDEAHGTGVWGKTGKGVSETLLRKPSPSAANSAAPHKPLFPLPQGEEVSLAERSDARETGEGIQSQPENIITLHTAGKALGVAGGIVCASAEIIDTLINTARPFIYSTAPPPLQAYLTHKALELSASEIGKAKRADLHKLCAYTKSQIGGNGSQIVPIIFGDDEKAVEAAQILQDSGFDIRAIRPPTVPEGTARLRLSLNAGLSEETLSDFFAKLRPLLLEQAA